MIGYRGMLRALMGGGAALGGYAIAVRPRLLRWGATDNEAHRTLPGDELTPNADGQSTMATTLPAAPDQVWPWLAQMGCNRAGWYSWDRLDNFGRPSAERIVPDWQHLAEGDHLDAVPSGASWFSVALVDPPHHLVLRTHLTLPSGRVFDLHGPPPKAFTDGIWAFHLALLPSGQTRLLVRTRGRSRPHLLRAVDFLFWEPAHLIMQTRQFHNLRRRLTPAQHALEGSSHRTSS